jgi:hypothetical protein
MNALGASVAQLLGENLMMITKTSSSKNKKLIMKLNGHCMVFQFKGGLFCWEWETKNSAKFYFANVKWAICLPL